MEPKVKIELELEQADPASVNQTKKEIAKIAEDAELLPVSRDEAFSGFFWMETSNTGAEDIWRKAEGIAAISNIRAVGPLLPMSSFLTPGGTPAPADPRWNHKMTRFDDAVELSRKAGRLDDAGSTGLTIAQLDTGYTLHEEIRGINGKAGKSFLPGEQFDNALDPLTDSFAGHGTSTASVVIGTDTSLPSDLNNGIFPMVNFVPYRIHGSVIHVGGTALPRAIRHAVDKLKCDVITLSMGGIPLFSNWKAAVDHAYEKGVILAAAAGNEVLFVVWPARYQNAIAVAAINSQGKPWEGSCRGGEVEISAPGEGVYVAKPLKGMPQFGWEAYNAVGNGTSFATPHVAAAAALWLNHFKGELRTKYFKSRPANKVDAFCWALRSSANTAYRLSSDFGAGILDAAELLEYSPSAYEERFRRLSDFSAAFAAEGRGAAAAPKKEPLSAIDRLDAVKVLYYLESSKARNIRSEVELSSYLAPRAAHNFKRIRGAARFDEAMGNSIDARISQEKSFRRARAADANVRSLYTEALINMLD